MSAISSVLHADRAMPLRIEHSGINSMCIQGRFGTDMIGNSHRKRRFLTRTAAQSGERGKATIGAGKLEAKLVKKATLKVVPGAPHGLCTTHADLINEELLAFLKQ